ncbi:MAG: dodecin domain-containing protein [Planctomycetes bacterium]|nr:dodecin domain-containing protein [Planctomycetota bacterium]
MSTIKIIELVGNSKKSWQDAAERAIHDASESLRHIQGVDVIKQTAVVEEGRIKEYRTTLHVAFLVEHPSHLIGTK